MNKPLPKMKLTCKFIGLHQTGMDRWDNYFKTRSVMLTEEQVKHLNLEKLDMIDFVLEYVEEQDEQ